MNERLLGLYWQIILVLLVGDIVVGIIWLFRYNLLLTNLRSDLIYRLDNDYGFDTDFQELWDRVQSEHQCCGIDTPYDYNMTQWFEREHATYEGAQFLVPQSCCAYHRFPMIPTILDSNQGGVDEGGGVAGANAGGVSSNSITSEGTVRKEGVNQKTSGSDNLNRRGNSGGGGGGGGGVGGYDDNTVIAARTTSADCMDSYEPENIYTTGCYSQILDWLQSSVDCLSVIGFCVITFLKLCFAFILRYELKEMIQKINLIKGDKERNDSTALQHLEAYLPRPSIQNDSNQALLSNQAPNSQLNTSHINSNNVNNNINIDNNSNDNSNNVINSNANTTNKRNLITANQSFNSSVGSYGTSCGDSTTINIPGRNSPQSLGTLGNTFSSSLSTSPPTNRLIISCNVSTTTSTTKLTTKSSNPNPSTIMTSSTSTTPATLITTVTSSSGAETTILPPSSSPTTSNNVHSSSFIGLINRPTGDKSNTKSKSFNNNGSSNKQVLVTNF